MCTRHVPFQPVHPAPDLHRASQRSLIISFCQGLSLATRLHFDFYSEAKQDNGEVSGLKTIDIQRLDKHQANEYELLSQLVSEHQVPEPLRYSTVPCKLCCCQHTRGLMFCHVKSLLALIIARDNSASHHLACCIIGFDCLSTAMIPCYVFTLLHKMA